MINVSKAMADQGVRSLDDMPKLKGKRFGVGALGSINQFNAAKALIKAGLDPAKDVQWIVNVPQPDLMKMLGQSQLEATDLAYQFGFFAQKNGWGPMIAPGDIIAPNGQISTYAIRKDYLAKNRDVVVRFAMAYLQGVKEFNAAAGAPDKFPEIVDILAKSTTLKDPAVIRAMAPNWSYTNEDGMPVVDSVMEMQDFWSGPYFKFVEKKVSRDQVFDLSIARKPRRVWTGRSHFDALETARRRSRLTHGRAKCVAGGYGNSHDERLPMTADREQLLASLEQKVSPDHAALIVVDVQNDFVADGGYFHQVGCNVSTFQKSAIPPLLNLIDEAREAGVLVVFIQAIYDAQYLSAPMRERDLRTNREMPKCQSGTWGADFFAVRPLPDEPSSSNIATAR